MDNEFKRLLIDALGEKLKGIHGLDLDDERYTPVGTVPKELLSRYKRALKDHEFFKDEIKLFLKQKELEIRKLTQETYGDRLEQMEQLKSDLWDEISDAVGVSRGDSLQINTDTGLITKRVKDDGKPDLKVVNNKDNEIH